MFVADTFAYTEAPQGKLHGTAVNATLGITHVLDIRVASYEPSQYYGIA